MTGRGLVAQLVPLAIRRGEVDRAQRGVEQGQLAADDVRGRGAVRVARHRHSGAAAVATMTSGRPPIRILLVPDLGGFESPVRQ